MLYHVVAMADNRVIGKDNRLPWHFSEDLKFFKHLTMGQTVIMGRKTFESIGKSLPGRENFVLTNSGFQKNDVNCFGSLRQALDSIATDHGYIIGGAQIFEETIDQVDGIYMTRIYADYEGDTFYPHIPEFFEEEPLKILREENPKIEVIFFRNCIKK